MNVIGKQLGGMIAKEAAEDTKDATIGEDQTVDVDGHKVSLKKQKEYHNAQDAVEGVGSAILGGDKSKKQRVKITATRDDGKEEVLKGEKGESEQDVTNKILEKMKQ